jgi:uncharacterized protein (TIGR02996 family)
MSDGLIEGFEAHLREEPNDLATWSAYADYLTEQGDPRGEFMAVQIALERKTTPAEERTRLKKREAELVRDLDCWLGPELACTIQETKPAHRDAVTLTFRRGWLQDLILNLHDYSTDRTAQNRLLEAIATAPEARWVLSLAIRPPDRTDIGPLGQATFMPVLRRLHIGGEEENSSAERVDGAELIFASAPRLESVRLCLTEPPDLELFRSHLPHLCEIVVGCAWAFFTAHLAYNESFRNLRTLRLVPSSVSEADEAYLGLSNLKHIANAPHLVSLTNLRFSLSDAGDAGIDVLIQSGLLCRLEVLDLSYGNVTDAGASALAAALTDRPHRLRLLNLRENALTDTGIATLQTLGLDLRVGEQHDPADRDYLFNGNQW